MKILISADPFLPVPPEHYGGIERIIAGLVEEFRNQGHGVALLAHPDSTCSADYGFSWSGEPGQANLLRHNVDVARALQEFKPDVWHSFSRLAYMIPALARSIPKVMSYQRKPNARTVQVASRLGRNLHFTGCSEHIASQGRRAGGDWTAIPNFVDLEKFTFVPNVADDAPLVFLSRVEEIKGPHWAIEIAKRSERKLIIAGNRPEGVEHEAFWEREIRPHLDGGQVQYAGAVNDEEKNELLGSAAALLVPIQWDEPFGIVFAESLACGTPLISCPRGSLPEIINIEGIGALITSIDEGVEAVEELTTFDRKACRIQAETRFSCSVIAHQYQRLYDRLVKEST